MKYQLQDPSNEWDLTGYWQTNNRKVQCSSMSIIFFLYPLKVLNLLLMCSNRKNSNCVNSVEREGYLIGPRRSIHLFGKVGRGTISHHYGNRGELSNLLLEKSSSLLPNNS